MQQIAISFVVGILSSLAATWLFVLRERARLRMRFRAIMSLIIKVARDLEQDNFSPEYIVTIDRNSGIVGSILAGHVGLRAVVSVACEHERLANGTRETRLDEVSSKTLRLLRGTRVLVLMCCNDTGTSLSSVVNYLRALGEDGPAEIRTAAIYTTVSPAIMPTYRAVIVGRDTRKPMNQIMSQLPWMTRTWRHHLSQERFAPQ